MGKLVIRNSSIETLGSFLEYIYKDSLPDDIRMSEEKLLELLLIGDMYLVPELVKVCASYLVDLISVSNIVSILRGLNAHARTPEAQVLKRQVKERVQDHDELLDALVNGV